MNKISILLITVFSFFVNSLFAQPLPCPPINTTWIQGRGDTTICNGGCTTIYAQDSTSVRSTSSYTFSTIPYLPTTFTGGTSILVGIDDIYSAVLPIPFPFCFYGTKYNSCIVGANGEICFNTALAGAFCPWSISGPIPTTTTELNTATLNTIMGPYYDIDPGLGGDINWAVYGTAPCRTFVVSWNNVPLFNTSFCPGLTGTQQIVLYESTYAIDIFVQHKVVCTAWNNGWGILGIVDATGANYNIPVGMNADTFTLNDAGFRFTPNGPASWSYVWTNHSGTVIGTTDTIVVCPTDSMTYTVTGIASSNCDSYRVHSHVFVNVGANPTVTHFTFTNPTMCGLKNGSIKLFGLVPGISDTIYYKYNGVLQPYVAQTAAIDSSLTLSPLCAGTYDSIVVKVGMCHTAPLGPIILTAPAITIGPATVDSPSVCGACDGKLVIHGLIPSKSYTFNYSFNGVAQPAVTITSDGAGTATISGLCAGVYSNITGSANIGPCVPLCVSNPIGPYTLVAPPPYRIKIDSFKNPTQCGYCDGKIRLGTVPPLSIDSIFYFFNGVPETLVVVAQADSSIYLQGLCAGAYTGFSVKIGPCLSPATGAATLVAPPLTASFTESIHFGCKGDTVFYYNGSTSAGALYYIWNFGDGTTDTATNPMHIFAQGVYTVTLIATNHFCSDSMKMQDSLVHPLHANFRAVPDLVCQGTMITFTNVTDSLSSLPLYYVWSFGDGTPASNLTSPTHTYPNTGTYKVQLIATNFVPCHDTVVNSVSVDSMPHVRMLSTDTVLCRATATTLTGLFTTIGYLGVTWNFGDGDTLSDVNPVTYSYDQTGKFIVTVTPHYRVCSDSTFTRTVSVIPKPGVYLGMDTSICPGGEVIVLTDRSGSNNTGGRWRWSTGETTPAITISAPGHYYVTVNIDGCLASDSIWVQNDCYMNIPNVFTPNGDGLNDYFYPRSYLTKGLTSFKMDIYNRWGQLLFETTSVDGEGWDGRFNGTEQPVGVYVYVIDATFKDGQKEHHQGNITLLR